MNTGHLINISHEDIISKLLRQLKSKDASGVITYVSPYDVPRALKAGRCDSDDNHFFCIEFTYLTSGEPTIARKQGEDISLEVGKHSGRVYQVKIRIPKEEFEAAKITGMIKGALTKLVKENYDNAYVAREIVADNKELIFAED